MSAIGLRRGIDRDVAAAISNAGRWLAVESEFLAERAIEGRDARWIKTSMRTG